MRGLLFAAVVLALPVAWALQTTVATTKYGPIQGLLLGSGNSTFRRFQGVPFARPPLPPLRWKKPQPPGSWGPQALDCRNFTIGCAQSAHSLDVPRNKSEDCLYLEVFAPPVGQAVPSAVILFFYGGDWHEGGESFQVYDGSHMASSLNTMLVVCNYRIGALGLMLPSASWGDPNVGIEDQRMAIRWVHENAAFFGADPGKLTLVGQSAGGESVMIHLTSPGNAVASMIHGGIAESGPLAMNYKLLPEARTLSRSFAIVLGCGVDDAACFQSKNTSQVLAATDSTINVPLSTSDLFQMWAPVITGVGTDSIEREPVEAFEKGLLVKVPFISGGNAQDGMLFSWAIADSKKLPSDEYVGLVGALFNEKLSMVPRILEMYPPSLFGDNKQVFSDVVTDYLFLCGTRFMLRHAEQAGMPTFSYLFNRAPPGCPWPKSQQYCCQSPCHGDELVYVFHDVAPPFPWVFPPPDVALADSMSSLWASFAHGSDTTAVWPMWRNATRQSMLFDTPSSIVTNIKGPQCDLWDQMGYSNERNGPMRKLRDIVARVR